MNETRRAPVSIAAATRRLITRSVGVLVMLSLAMSCSRNPEPDALDVRIGIARQPSSALLHIALDKGFFEAEGLNVQVSHFPSGKRALMEGLLPGAVDYITTADIPFVWQSFEQHDLRILATLYHADNVNRIIARRDAGIAELVDLKGKRVATQKQSAVHYFLHMVMISGDIPHADVSQSFHKAEDLPSLLARGEIDAFSMREPYISQAKEMLGEDNCVVFDKPGLYLQNELLVGRLGSLETNPRVAQRLMKGLVRAEQFAHDNPEEAMRTVTRLLDADEQGIRDLWHSFDLVLGLDHSLIVRLEQQAEWMLDERLVENARLPDMKQRIYPDALQQIKPQAVMLIL